MGKAPVVQGGTGNTVFNNKWDASDDIQNIAERLNNIENGPLTKILGRQVEWVEYTSFDVLSSFASPGVNPRGLAWSGPNILWHADDDDTNKIYALNTSGTIFASFDGPGTDPTGLTWDGSNLWNADSTRGRIYKINTSGTILSSFDGPGVNPRGLAWDGSNLWNTDAAGRGGIFKIAPHSGLILRAKN